MRHDLERLALSFQEELKKTTHLRSLEEIEIKYLGRKGLLTEILKNLKNLEEEKRREIGSLGNTIKNSIEESLKEKKSVFEKNELEKSLKEEWIDLTAPGKRYEIGHIHPLSIIQEEVETIFSQMGFAVMDGPEVESEYYNFEGLNIPGNHPARDMQDTFFIDKKPDDKQGRLVLRTHTSPVQVRTMEKYGAPLRVIVPGRTFRYEATDASHDTTFYQVEGLLIDENISIASLKGVMVEFLSRLFDKKVSVRFRPGYFPFVEPGMELDFSCLLCNGNGCRVCKHTGWMEFMGAGMVHPNVLSAGKIDASKYQGWAFGFGLTRLTMMRYGIDDIRLLLNGDLRFIQQFSS
ncbi:phenylalanine--tRNA ligase subunit alpha [Candidatus Peregrinibacteria bacterium]|nr:phenylalanine--tRNA ligase subunit alpha [Candidatus Peregrinibacteria bacterium]